MVACPKFWHEITAWDNRSNWYNFSDRTFVSVRATDWKEFQVGVGGTERGEPLDASVVLREIGTTQVLWKGKNQPDLCNTKSYQPIRWIWFSQMLQSSFKSYIPSK
jgi:hypothetical protein